MCVYVWVSVCKVIRKVSSCFSYLENQFLNATWQSIRMNATLRAYIYFSISW